MLCQIAGLSYENAAAMTAGDLHIADGTATIHTPGGKATLRGHPRHPAVRAMRAGPLGACPGPNGRLPGRSSHRRDHRPGATLTPDSPHLCHSTTTITQTTRRVPLLPLDGNGVTGSAGLCCELPNSLVEAE